MIHDHTPKIQTERRIDLVDLDPFRYDTPDGIAAWVAHLAGIEERLRLFHARPGMLTTGTMPEYLIEGSICLSLSAPRFWVVRPM